VKKIVKNLIRQENGKNYIETTHKRNEQQQELIKKKKKSKYPIQYARRISGINFIRYLQSQNYLEAK
jgi:hypothetical protein